MPRISALPAVVTAADTDIIPVVQSGTTKRETRAQMVTGHDILAAHVYTGGAALDLFGLSAADTLAKLTPSSAPGAASAILKTSASGILQLEGLGLGVAPLNLLHARTNPATTNTVVDVLRLDRATSGTAADGIGAGLVLYAEDASGNIEEAGRINAVFTTAAHATQAGRVDITAMGAATGIHAFSDGKVSVGGTTGSAAQLSLVRGTGNQVFLDLQNTGATVGDKARIRFSMSSAQDAGGAEIVAERLGVNAQSALELFTNNTDGTSVEQMRIDQYGNVGIGTTSPSNPLHGATNPATTNTVVDVLRLDRTTSGTAADGIGAGLVLYAEDASGNVEEAGRINAIFTTAAHATQAGRVDITAMGAATGVHVLSNGNVGIGTTGPGSTLHVNGSFEAGDRSAYGHLFYIGTNGSNWSGLVLSPGAGRDLTLGMAHGKAVIFINQASFVIAKFDNNSGDILLGGTNALTSPVVTVKGTGNVGIGTTVFGATAAGVLALGGTATAPTTSVDLVHLYGEDISAGNRALAIYQESAVIVAAGIASTHKIPVRWNGTTYYLMASDV